MTLAGNTHGAKEAFSRTFGEWAYWSNGKDSHVHAVPFTGSFEYVFTYSGSGWAQEVRRCPWDKVACLRLDLPHLRLVTMHPDGSFTLAKKHHLPADRASWGAPQEARIRKREGLNQPIFVLAPDDEYLALAYSEGIWFALSPRLPLQNHETWIRNPPESWEADFSVEFAGLEFIGDNSLRIDGQKVKLPETGSFLRPMKPLIISCLEPGSSLDILHMESRVEWKFLYRHDRWWTRVKWVALKEDIVVAGIVRLGPDSFQIVPRFQTCAAWEAIEPSVYEGYKVWKAEGEREILWLKTPSQLVRFICAKSVWYVLCASTETFEFPTVNVSKIENPPGLTYKAKNNWLEVGERLGWTCPSELTQLFNWAQRIQGRIERLRAEQVVWVTHTDLRFGVVREGVSLALEPRDLCGIGLYHGGAVRVGRAIFGRRERVDCKFGTRRVRRDPLSADELQIDQYCIEANSWSSIHYRYRGGQWWRRVRRDHRDEFKVLALDMAKVGTRCLKYLLTTGIPAAINFLLSLKLFERPSGRHSKR